ncbi:MAG TPA: hypothetical protein PKH39_01910 [Woeseiaceae bacterium]|nr:hypothetical protein [Woeseiaceae bacterium]
MKFQASGFSWLVGAGLVLGGATAWAQVDTCEILGSDRYSGCPEALSQRDSAEPYRSECKQVAAERRSELQEWGIDAKSLSDVAVFDRYDRALVERCKADREQSRQNSLESDRQAADREAADAERARVNAEREKQAEEYGAQQLKAGQAMMQGQNEMLKGLGVDLGDLADDEEEMDEDEEYSPVELQMYQRMVDEGMAPGCKGLSGADLVDCVDDALDEE